MLKQKTQKDIILLTCQNFKKGYDCIFGRH